MSKEIGGVFIEVKDGVTTVFKRGEVPEKTRAETNELNEELKQELIEKIKNLPDYEGSKLQEVIKKRVLEFIDF